MVFSPMHLMFYAKAKIVQERIDLCWKSTRSYEHSFQISTTLCLRMAGFIKSVWVLLHLLWIKYVLLIHLELFKIIPLMELLLVLVPQDSSSTHLMNKRLMNCITTMSIKIIQLMANKANWSLKKNHKFLDKSIYFWLAFQSHCFHGCA